MQTPAFKRINRLLGVDKPSPESDIVRQMKSRLLQLTKPRVLTMLDRLLYRNQWFSLPNQGYLGSVFGLLNAGKSLIWVTLRILYVKTSMLATGKSRVENFGFCPLFSRKMVDLLSRLLPEQNSPVLANKYSGLKRRNTAIGLA